MKRNKPCNLKSFTSVRKPPAKTVDPPDKSTVFDFFGAESQLLSCLYLDLKPQWFVSGLLPAPSR